MEDKLVSIIMPVFNGEKYLKESIESILNQTYNNFELIIIDDGSNDKTIDIINAFTDNRIRLFKNNRNMGLVYTRNLGLNICKGDFIAFMDADDIAIKNRLYCQVEFFTENKDIDIVGSYFYTIDLLGRTKLVKMPVDPQYIRIFLMFKSCLANSTVMIRKDILKKYNLRYVDKYFVTQDYRFWVDSSKYVRISNIEKPLIYYRCGHENITKKSIENKKKERKKLLDETHEIALIQNGFQLDNKQLKIFNKFFSDSLDSSISYLEIVELIECLKNIDKINDSNNIFNSRKFKLVLVDVFLSLINSLNIDLRYKVFLYISLMFKIKYFNLKKLFIAFAVHCKIGLSSIIK